MPERWEHELKKLREVERPSTLEDRVAEGPHPHHEPGRPTRERVAAAVVAFAVCAAVGVFGYRTLSNDDVDGGSNVATGVSSGDETLVLELATSLGQPSATLLYGDERQEGVFESTNWCPNGVTVPDAECSSSIADFAFFPPVNAFLVVPPGTPIELTGNGSVAAWQIKGAADGHTVDGSESGETPLAHVPGVDGRYAINVGAHWALGDANVWFGVQVLSSESAAPDVLTVDCSLGLAQTDTSVVRTQSNGLAIQVVNDTGSSDLEVQQDDGDTIAIRQPNAHNGAEFVYGVAPGSFAIGCGRNVSRDATVPFELVDPDENYASWDLACGDLPQTSFTSTVPASHPHDLAISELLWGLAPDDRIRGAGYAADMWRLGPTYVVQRNRESVVRVVLGEEGETWSGTFQACDGTGITLSEKIVTTGGGGSGPTGSAPSGPTSATGVTAVTDTPLPSTLVVRCEGLGSAVDSTTVLLQVDGLHIDATNVADAFDVRVEDADGLVPGGEIVFERANERATLDIPSGTYWVGCENGMLIDTRAGHVEAPDSYIQIDVLPSG
jgi:hypothetical protein